MILDTTTQAKATFKGPDFRLTASRDGRRVQMGILRSHGTDLYNDLVSVTRVVTNDVDLAALVLELVHMWDRATVTYTAETVKVSMVDQVRSQLLGIKSRPGKLVGLLDDGYMSEQGDR